MDEIITKEMITGASVLQCKEVRSGYFENDGKGKFTFHAFPSMAQVAPINAIVCTDLNADGNIDIIAGGNEYQAQVTAGCYDASYGLVLTGNTNGSFKVITPVVAGLMVDGDIRDLKMVTANDQKLLLVAVNNSAMKALAITKK